MAEKLLARVPEQSTEEYAILLALAAPERVQSTLAELRGPIKQPFVLIAWAMLAGPPVPDAPRTELQDEVERSDDPWIKGLVGFSNSYLGWAANRDRAAAIENCRSALRHFQDLGEVR